MTFSKVKYLTTSKLQGLNTCQFIISGGWHSLVDIDLLGRAIRLKTWQQRTSHADRFHADGHI